jgi:hypothetical protein
VTVRLVYRSAGSLLMDSTAAWMAKIRRTKVITLLRYAVIMIFSFINKMTTINVLHMLEISLELRF